MELYTEENSRKFIAENREIISHGKTHYDKIFIYRNANTISGVISCGVLPLNTETFDFLDLHGVLVYSE